MSDHMPGHKDGAQIKPGVFIVSHEPAIRTLLAEMLAVDGYSSQQAENGADGLTLIRQANEGHVSYMLL